MSYFCCLFSSTYNDLTFFYHFFLYLGLNLGYTEYIGTAIFSSAVTYTYKKRYVSKMIKPSGDKEIAAVMVQDMLPLIQ